jgi:hypothetical protein
MRTTITITWMLLSLAVAAAVVPVAAGRSEDASSDLDDLAWMAGSWTSEGKGQHLIETWAAPAGDALSGMFTWARDGKVWLYELMTIEKEEVGLVFRLRHFSRGLVPWKSEAEEPLTYPLLEMGPNRVVFENPERDKPRRFIYERTGDVFSVRLESADGKGDEFRFTRAR